MANVFFLIDGLLPLLPGISNVRPLTALMPIVTVLLIAMFRELVVDLRRFAFDRTVNARPVVLVGTSSAAESATVVPWRQLAVGDVIEVKADDSVPADIVVLRTGLPSGLAYVETASLDGEVNLKIHETPKALPEIATTPIGALTGSVTCELPNNRLYRFEGSLRIAGHADEVPLSNSNVLLRGSVLRNTPYVIGIVVYTGKETKIAMNSVAPLTKRSTLDRAVDYAIASMFAFSMTLCAIAALMSQLQPLHEHVYVHDGKPALASSGTFEGGLFTFVSFLVLFTQLLPLSLPVMIQSVKIIHTLFMQGDLHMYSEARDTRVAVNNTGLTDELGQIEMIMSDKTGTLTQNSMVFQCLAVGRRAYDLRLDADADTCRSRQSLDADLADSSTSHGQQLRFFWLALALCHTVIVESDIATVDEDGGVHAPDAVAADVHVKYQASSPDEQALVMAARDRGFELRQRKTNALVVRVDGRDEEFEVLAINEFDSTRKRMSVLIRFPDQSVYLIVKGADSVIETALATDDVARDENFVFDREQSTDGFYDANSSVDDAASAVSADSDDRLPPVTSDRERAFVNEALLLFAREGLRTLLVAWRRFSPQQTASFMAAYRAASVAMTNRQQRLAQLADRVERHLTLLGATAIEDKLQEGVPETISKLALAGIKLWVLTGDKVETAINVACSCNLIEANTKVVKITDGGSSEDVSALLDRAFARISALNTSSDDDDDDDDNEGNDESGADDAADGVGLRLDSFDSSEEAHSSLTLVIDGASLELVLADALLTHNFLQVARNCRSVIFCRVSPLQKSLVVKLARLGLKARCLAIGDGANDVAMIQAAQVGVGISGNEGMQAVAASDFAIAQFRFLQDLLLVHGRNNYRRLCALAKQTVFKNVAFVLCQFFFGLDSGWSAENLYDGSAMAMYNLLFTTLPLVCLGVFNRDVSREMALQVPQLYETGRLSHDFTAVHVLIRVLTGVYSSCVIWFMTRAACENDVLRFDGLVSDQWILGVITNQSVILTATGSVMLAFRLWTRFHVAAVAFSVLSWWAYLLIFSELDGQHFDRIIWFLVHMPVMWLTAVVIPLAALLPEIVWVYVQRQIYTHNDQVLVEVELSGRTLSADEIAGFKWQRGVRSVPVPARTANYMRRGILHAFGRQPPTYATQDMLSDVDVLRRLNLFNPLASPLTARERLRRTSLTLKLGQLRRRSSGGGASTSGTAD